MRSRETKVKVHNQWLETDREKHPSAQRKRLGRFIRVMTHFRAPWSKSLIVASTFATPCLPRRELYSLDATGGRFTGTVALLARITAVGHHFDLRPLYRSRLLDYQRYHSGREIV